MGFAPNKLLRARHRSAYCLNDFCVPIKPVIRKLAIVAASRIRDSNHSILSVPDIAVSAIARHITVCIVSESGAGSTFHRDLIGIRDRIVCTVSSGNCCAIVSTAQNRTRIEACRCRQCRRHRAIYGGRLDWLVRRSAESSCTSSARCSQFVQIVIRRLGVSGGVGECERLSSSSAQSLGVSR